MRTVALVCLLVPALAWAREDPGAGVSHPTQTVLAGLNAPIHSFDCALFRPQNLPEVQGSTDLSVRIAADGRAKRIEIVNSSGSSGLDHVAAKCVSTIHLVPKTIGGIPIEVDWRMEVMWPGGRLRTPHADGSDNSCARFYPASAVRSSEEGDTLVSFVVSTDGSVKNVDIIERSGHADLDAAAVQCVSQFRYYPAIRDGKAVEIDGKVTVPWRLR